MKTSNTLARKFSSTVVKILIALIFVSMIGGISIAPAFGRDGVRHRGHHHHGRHYHHGRYYHHGRHYQHGGYYQHGRYYMRPVYAPPPVVYAPDQYQSEGVGLVFGAQIR
jgi:hypothetical protein